MIDVSRIENVKKLQEMSADLKFFINKKIIADLYEAQGQSNPDLAEDRRLARELLEKVTDRLTQLGINRPTKKKGSTLPTKGTKGTPLEE